jgi:hypothetical protein
MMADINSFGRSLPYLRIVILGLLLMLCSSVTASDHGNLHDSAHLAHGHRNARRAEGVVGNNAPGSTETRGVDPRADPSTMSTVLFNSTILANFGFSGPCIAALSATLNCSEAVHQDRYLYTWGGLTESDIEAVCTESCAESFAAQRASVAAACAKDVYVDPVVDDTGYVYGTGFGNGIYNVESISARPVSFVDYYLLSYKLLCMKNECVTVPCSSCSRGAALFANGFILRCSSGKPLPFVT